MDITPSRREVLIGALLPLLQAASSAATPAQETRPQNLVFEHDLPNVTLDGWQVNVSTITLPPGSVGTAHRHPGFVLVYVLEGEVVTKVSDQQQATYSAGQMFYEQPGSAHEAYTASTMLTCCKPGSPHTIWVPR